jgi:hypothetical protein
MVGLIGDVPAAASTATATALVRVLEIASAHPEHVLSHKTIAVLCGVSICLAAVAVVIVIILVMMILHFILYH